jgi:hypothetical protein
MSDGSDAYLKRQAMQLAAQLPEKAEDAHLVIVYLQQLVENFVYRHEADDTTPDHEVFDFRPEVGPTSPSRRAKSSGKPSARPK